MLGIAAVLICAAMLAVAVLQGRDFSEMMLTAISLAVAAVPEGLPAVVTIVLALGVQRLVKVNTIVRRLPSVETLGAVSVVCSDKTGTLTQNKMTVVKIYRNGVLAGVSDLNETDDGLFLEGFTLCNDASALGGIRTGDPTELALIDMGALKGLVREEMEKTSPRINERAFDSDRKLMTTVHEKGGEVTAYTKGAMDNILERSAFIYENGNIRPISEADKEKAADAAREMARGALRVLGLGLKTGDESADESGLTFVGLVGMIDPPRPEAKNSVAVFRQAGIRTVMITGDHKDTALAIARELGIAEDENQCATGAMLDGMSQEELNAKVESLRVFARVSPQHKVMIVRALKKYGHIVSMTGDGVNDAPSLKEADIGVAMGITGTDVAKGAADMVLTDDNFSTIEKAVEEGRNIYGNIKKSVLFLLSSNFGEIICMFAAILAGLASPLKAIHILWVNLITDSLPSLALGVDKGGKDTMLRKPRKPEESLFARGGLAVTLFYGALVGFITLFAFLLIPAMETGLNFAAVKNWLSDGENLKTAQTFALVTLGTSQLFHGIGMRDVGRSVFRMNHMANKTMILAFFGGLALQLAVTEVPFLVAAFDTVRLAPQQWGLLLLISAVPLFAHEIIVLIGFALKKARAV
jgi:Ca2+-transporting ATPase